MYVHWRACFLFGCEHGSRQLAQKHHSKSTENKLPSTENKLPSDIWHQNIAAHCGGGSRTANDAEGTAAAKHVSRSKCNLDDTIALRHEDTSGTSQPQISMEETPFFPSLPLLLWYSSRTCTHPSLFCDMRRGLHIAHQPQRSLKPRSSRRTLNTHDHLATHLELREVLVSLDASVDLVRCGHHAGAST